MFYQDRLMNLLKKKSHYLSLFLIHGAYYENSHLPIHFSTIYGINLPENFRYVQLQYYLSVSFFHNILQESLLFYLYYLNI